MPARNFTDAEKSEINRLYDEGTAIKTIAKRFKTCAKKVSALVVNKRSARDTTRLLHQKNPPPLPFDVDELNALYDQGASIKELARKFRTCAKKVSEHIRNKRTTYESAVLDAAEKGLLLHEVAETVGVNIHTAAKYLKKNGVRIQNRKTKVIRCWGETFLSIVELHQDPRCEVTAAVLRQRLADGEQPETAVKARKRTPARTKPVSYQGKTYPSVAELARHLGVPQMFLAAQIRKGKDESEWTNYRPLTGIEYQGKTFASVRELAEHLGMGRERLANRIKQGWPQERWADIEGFEGAQHNLGMEVEYQGVTYPSIRALAKAFHVDYKLVHLRKSQGLSLEECLKPARDLSITWMGHVFPSASQLAAHLGISNATLLSRIKKGWAEEDWGKKTPQCVDRKRQIVYQGQNFRSIKELASFLGLTKGVLTRRMRAGLPEEQWGQPARSKFREITIEGVCYSSMQDLANAAGVQKGTMQARLASGWQGVDLLRPLATTSNQTCKKKSRAINCQRIKDLLNGLREHVGALSPRDIYILLQQHNLDNLPKEEGGILVQRLTGGTLPPDLIRDWINGDEPEPPTPTQPRRKPQPAPGADPGDDGGDQPAPPTAGEPPAPPKPVVKPNPEPGDESPDLPKVTAEEALKLLTSHAWATDDAEAAEALICSNLDKVWNHAYTDEQAAVEQVRAFNGNSWTDELRNRFLSVYNRAKGLQLPAHYVFPHQPRLMQLVAAAEAAERRRLLILSGMGLGKTLAALLATQAAGCGLIWVVCPNNAIDQWERAIAEQWQGVEVRKKVINPQWATTGPRILLLNFERFSYLKDEQIAELMADSCPDAFIIDEVQFAKQRTDEFQSTRRQQLAKCIQLAGEHRPDLMVLGMSGTPILNNLMEGRKLIELVFAEERTDLKTDTNIHNAMRMFQEFTRLGIRQRGADIWPVEVHTMELDASSLLDDLREVKRQRGHLAAYEQVLLRAKLPTITQLCTAKPTVVVTEFVEGIVEPLREALLAEGLRVGIFTGQNKHALYGPYADALEEFKAGATDVLIGSTDCMGTGIDGLQHRCCQMVFATLPWTDAELQQVIARLARHGQEHEVDIHVPLTGLSYITSKGELAEWSFCSWRWSVLSAKRALAACAVDGVSPGQDERLTPQKALRYIEGWLERLGNDTVIARYGRPIRVPLVFSSEVEELTARRRYGDFSACNARWGNANSSATHARLNVNPQEWELYHTDLSAHRKEWLVDPLQEVIKHCRTTKGMVIGDFGCGTAELADAVRGRHQVHSFDHIAINDGVTACDIGQGVPLEDECLDLAVFSLSLMGSNWRDYLAEAYRCLKPTGQLIIWHPANQTSAELMPAALQRAGFKAIETVERYKWLHIWAVRVPNAVPLVAS